MIQFEKTQSNKNTYVEELTKHQMAIRIYQQENPKKYSLQYRKTNDKQYTQYKTINETDIESQLSEVISLINTIGRDEFIKFVETYKQEKNRNGTYELISTDEKIKMKINQNKSTGLTCKVFDTPINETEARYFTLTNNITSFQEAQKYIENEMSRYNETGKYQRKLLRKGDVELTHEQTPSNERRDTLKLLSEELFPKEFVDQLYDILGDTLHFEEPVDAEKHKFLSKMSMLYTYLILKKIDPLQLFNEINEILSE